MTARLFRRRSIWWPTAVGWLGILGLASAPVLAWWFRAESFLAETERLPADTLIVESWIGAEGFRAAGSEFRTGGYQYLVITGGLTGDSWSLHRWNEVEEAVPYIAAAGVPRARIIAAPMIDAENHRTFEMAVAAWRALRERGIRPRAINVFTMGAHARRSRLVFAKVFASEAKVGVISWRPPGYYSGPWWRSSDRALALLKETVGYVFELVLNSGRLSNSAAPAHGAAIPGS